jgi:hypothetical protein
MILVPVTPSGVSSIVSLLLLQARAGSIPEPVGQRLFSYRLSVSRGNVVQPGSTIPAAGHDLGI